MIKDNIKNAENYFNLPERVKVGLKYLTNTDFSHIENGKYEVSEGVFAIVQDYFSKPESEGKFEAHKKYIDIQYIIEGEEKIGVGNLENFVELTPYDSEKDIIFLNPKNKTKEFINIKEKEFAIFMPDDVHMPSITIKEPGHVKKAVVKVLK